MAFLGVDHVDLRVPALGAVEAFYDALLSRLGLTRKQYSVVTFGGESWRSATNAHYNAVEWVEEVVTDRAPAFFGVIEEEGAQPSRARIAFAVPEDALDAWETELRAIGARDVERSDDPAYPAVFFADPLGTRLEVCARRPRA